MKENQNVSETAEMTKEKPERNSNKKRLGVIGAVAVIIIALLVGIGIYQSPASRLSRQLDLGQRYLEEMNYEQAVVVFNNVIEIDPMNVDAYLGLVEVYIRTGDFDTALEYAQKGYELTGDERLKEKIDMIESGNITASNGWTMKRSEYSSGRLNFYETYTYNLQGRIKSNTLYNEAGLVVQCDWQYDDRGNNIVGYGGIMGRRESSEPMSLTIEKYENEYDSENRITGCKQYTISKNSIEYAGFSEWEYNPAGVLSARKHYDSHDNLYGEDVYNEEGQRLVAKYYDSSGSLEYYHEYEYDIEGRETGYWTYNGSGDLKFYAVYELDAEGKRTRREEYNYDGSGNLTSSRVTEYDTKGRAVTRKSYDASGNLTSEQETKYE